jgi:predicted ATPase
MSVRSASLGDSWRRTFTRRYLSSINELSFENLLCLVDGKINIPPGICAIVGGNGVGKSALLAAISEVLQIPGAITNPAQRDRLENSKLTAKITDNNVEKEIKININHDGSRDFIGEHITSECHWIEPSLLVNKTLDAIHGDSEFESVLGGITPIKLEPDELKIISYLTGKKIDDCEIYEVLEYGDLETFPYFIASSYESQYGSESMGLGELSLLILYWKIRTIPKNSAIIIEEPETHVSPRSQRALMDILAKSCDEKGLSIVLTTHSPAVISNLPKENLVLISRDGAKTKATLGASILQINSLLGVPIQCRALLLVEDRAAQQFLISLLSLSNYELLSQIDILIAGDYSKISTVLNTIPATRGRWLDIVGIYDSDMQGKIKLENTQWPHLFLPGEGSPELSVYNSLMNEADPKSKLSQSLGRPVLAVSTALDSQEGADMHDWYTQIPKILSCDHQTLMNALVSIWLETNAREAETFISNLISSINRP